jgi:hypothetical protein
VKAIMNRTFWKSAIKFWLFVAFVGVVSAADQQGHPPASDLTNGQFYYSIEGDVRVIRETKDSDGTRDGITVRGQKITKDPDHVKVGKQVEVTAMILHLTPEQMKGRSLAIQIMKTELSRSVQKELYWVTVDDDVLKSGRFNISVKCSFTETGKWKVVSGLVDKAKNEWWLRSASTCTVVP